MNMEFEIAWEEPKPEPGFSGTADYSIGSPNGRGTTNRDTNTLSDKVARETGLESRKPL